MKKLKELNGIEIKQLYLSGSSLRDLAQKYNCSAMLVRRKLHQLNVTTNISMKKYSEKCSKAFKKYQLNDNVFNIIDTEEKAYWLGFLYADGYNHVSKHQVVLRLNDKDLDALEKFQSFLETDAPIHHNYYNGTQSELLVCSIQLSNKLNELGCIQNKTYTLEFPKFISDNLIRHFIRGYFDGDGCISITKRKDRKSNKSLKYQFTITGKKEFLLDLQKILVEKVNVKLNDLNKSENNFAQAIHYSGKNVVYKLLDYLYKDAKVYLNRKYFKYLECIPVE